MSVPFKLNMVHSSDALVLRFILRFEAFMLSLEEKKRNATLGSGGADSLLKRLSSSAAVVQRAAAPSVGEATSPPEVQGRGRRRMSAWMANVVMSKTDGAGVGTP